MPHQPRRSKGHHLLLHSIIIYIYFLPTFQLLSGLLSISECYLSRPDIVFQGCFNTYILNWRNPLILMHNYTIIIVFFIVKRHMYATHFLNWILFSSPNNLFNCTWPFSLLPQSPPIDHARRISTSCTHTVELAKFPIHIYQNHTCFKDFSYG